MTEREYMIVSSLARLRIAKAATCDAIYDSLEDVTSQVQLRKAATLIEAAIDELQAEAELRTIPAAAD